MLVTFQKWPSIPRLSKERMIITEKIDGTNACVIICPVSQLEEGSANPLVVTEIDGVMWAIWAQSRSRFITVESDNFGFAKWVYQNADGLVEVLGIGKHYGEWWGSGVQRGYDIGEKRFSLFNAPYWQDSISYLFPTTPVKELRTVPLLYAGPVDWTKSESVRETLSKGSVAAPNFKGKAEGMVVFLREAQTSYKILLENDELHKWEVQS